MSSLGAGRNQVALFRKQVKPVAARKKNKSGKKSLRWETATEITLHRSVSNILPFFFFFLIVFPVGQKTPESAGIMRKTKYSWGAFVGRGSKLEKMSGENARMLPKTTHEERMKQEAKRRGKLKTMAGKLLKVVASGKETAEEKAGSEDVAGNLLKMATSRKEVEGETPAGNLEVISGSSPGLSLPLPALQTLVFVSFWSRCFTLSSSPSFT